MLIEPTKIKEKIDYKEFLRIINRYNENQIICTKHTFIRLSEKQREVYNCDELKKIILEETPFLIGIQNNKNYAVFYKYKSKNLRIMLGISARKINIVTFYFIQEWQIPKI